MLCLQCVDCKFYENEECLKGIKSVPDGVCLLYRRRVARTEADENPGQIKMF